MTLLRSHLISQVDQNLTDSAGDLGQRTVDQLTAGRVSPNYVLPSDYYVRVQVGDETVAVFINPQTEDSVGRPAVDTVDLDSLGDADREPVTVPGENSLVRWRATTLPVSEVPGGPTVGAVTVAVPLAQVDLTIGRTSWLILLSGIVIVAVGAVAALVAVRRALRPLREIESTAGAIAAGDLSRRVPTLPATTEVGSLAGSLNVMLAQIEQSFAARTASEQRMRRFVSDASHELRTPLATIRGYGELYRMGGVSENDVPQAMGRIESEAKRMGVLVEDLLQLARLDEGRPLHLDRVDLAAIARDAAADLHAQDPTRPVDVVPLAVPAAGGAGSPPVPASGGTTTAPATSPDGATAPRTAVPGSAGSPPVATYDGGTYDDGTSPGDRGAATPAPGPVVVTADANRIRQVVANLMGNVLQHTPTGTAVEVAVGMIEPGWAQLEVRDHGPGIASADADRVFERFYRVDPSRTRSSGGSGLGLAIVAAVLGAHGGAVRVVPTPGGGTTVQVALPVSGPVEP
ncbi:HAMP domain-containing protein [Georgenia subflava]|uniref:histidine kinase n=2 Tax=Georgenia subflava TaxID=1622177 RepID=A0A6N7ENM5_9MICO|nr:HAMP domain-containing protein [Georgenia subflava]